MKCYEWAFVFIIFFDDIFLSLNFALLSHLLFMNIIWDAIVKEKYQITFIEQNFMIWQIFKYFFLFAII